MTTVLDHASRRAVTLPKPDEQHRVPTVHGPGKSLIELSGVIADGWAIRSPDRA